jgi:hypothetical protein
MKRLALPLLLAVIAGCESVPTPPPPSDTRPREVDYSTWVSVTEEPYEVPISGFLPCAYRAPTSEEMQALKTQRHGPHAVYAIHVKVNPVGLDAFRARTPVPVGTVVVKEKMTGGKVVAVGTMTKREPSYDSDHGDWEYGYRELKADAPPPSAGKIDSCIACHRIAEKKDHLFRTYLPHQQK